MVTWRLHHPEHHCLTQRHHYHYQITAHPPHLIVYLYLCLCDLLNRCLLPHQTRGRSKTQSTYSVVYTKCTHCTQTVCHELPSMSFNLSSARIYHQKGDFSTEYVNFFEDWELCFHNGEKHNSLYQLINTLILNWFVHNFPQQESYRETALNSLCRVLNMHV